MVRNRVSVAKKLGNKVKHLCNERHYSIHSPNKTLYWCNYCEDHVLALNKNLCECCRQPLERQRNFHTLEKILNYGYKQNAKLIREWLMWPDKEIKYVEIFYKDVVYEIPLKLLALSRERVDKETRESTLAYINKHRRYKGFRIWIPEEEQTDTTCGKCGYTLKLDKRGCIFCEHCVLREGHIEQILL